MTIYDPYPNIDLVRSGKHLKKLVKQKAYTVKDIQKLLHLSCPQPVYRWFKGQALPSVGHLYVLSKLLHVHMEDLLFTEGEGPRELMPQKEYLLYIKKSTEQIMHYWRKLKALI